MDRVGKMIEKKAYLLDNKIQNYAWGTKNENAFIPQLLNIPVERDLPYAELWIGAHDKAPSVVKLGDDFDYLNNFISRNPNEILGKRVAEKFSNKLPFLFKVLSAAEALSIQAHPDKKFAEILHQIDPVNYPDDNHKPEIAIALDELEAVVGFKPYDEIKRLLTELPFLSDLFEERILKRIYQLLSRNETEKEKGLRLLYTTLLETEEKNNKLFKKVVKRLRKHLYQKEDKTEIEKLYFELYSKYGADIGLISILLFNYVKLKKGEALFLKSGIPHAYLKGNIIECMANSDNVIRAGLTPKFVDKESIKDVLNYKGEIYPKVEIEKVSGRNIYKTSACEFVVEKLNSGKHDLNTSDSINIFLSVKGEFDIDISGDKYRFFKGNSVLIPAVAGDFKLSHEDSEIFRVYVP